MDINDGSFNHLQDCANGLRGYVADGKLDDALKVATYLLKEGQLAILNMKKGEVKDFYPKVTALLETLENSNIDSHPKLRHTVAKTARVFAQLAVDRMGEPFPEDIKNDLLGRIKPRLAAAKVGNQFALRYELFCLQEAIKGIDTGISLFNLSLAGGVVKGGIELAKGEGAGSLLGTATSSLEKLHAMWYADALRLSWVGVMGKDDSPTFEFFLENVEEYVNQCKFVDLDKRHVLIGLVDTFAEITWTSTIEQHQKTAAVWVANFANTKQPRARLQQVRYRAVEQLIAMKMHHVDGIRALATLQLQSRQKTEKNKMVKKLFKAKFGPENTGFREGLERVPTRLEIDELLKDPIEALHDDVNNGHAEIMGKLNRLSPTKVSAAEQAISIIRLNSSHRNFVGREAELDGLYDWFLGEEWEHQQSCKVALLHGLGGMGKTELALRFANKWRSKFSFVYTIPAESAEARAGAYHQLANQLGVELGEKATPDQVRKKLFAHLESSSFEKPYLLFYDNVEDKLEFPTRNGHLLLTARNQKFAPVDLKVRAVELRPMEEEEGLALLKKWTGEQESPKMKVLFRKLGGYPFVLAQAGAYIGSNPLLTVAKYAKAHKVPNSASPEERYQKTLQQVLSLSFRALRKESSLAFEWLQICSYLNPDNIPLSYLEKYFPNEAHRGEVALAVTNCSLMHFENEAFSTHRFIPQELQKRDSNGEALKKASSLLAGIEFDFDTFTDYGTLQTESSVWASHAELLLELDKEIPPANRAQLLDQMGKFEMLVLRQYEKALTHLNQSLNIQKKVYREDHPYVANSLNNIGNVLGALGQHEEALEHHNQALNIYKTVYSENHPTIADSLIGIGNALSTLGWHEEALKHYNQALNIYKTVYSENHPTIAESLISIGNVLSTLDRHEEALEHHSQALNIYKTVYSENHPTIAGSLTGIGNALSGLGRHEEALKHHNQALNIYKTVYGENHPTVASPLNNIGLALIALGQHEEALKHHNQALDILEKVYREDHPHVAKSLNNTAIALYRLGRHEEALKHCLQLLAIYKKVDGEGHPDVARSLHNIGLLYQKMKKPEKAKKYFQQAVIIGEKVLPSDDPDLKHLRSALAGVDKHD